MFYFFKKQMCFAVKTFFRLKYKGYNDKAAFVVYPTSENFLYSAIYKWPWLLKKAKWFPVPIPRMYIPYESDSLGMKKLSDSKIGLYFGISALESDVKKATDFELAKLYNEAVQIQSLCGFQHCRFSGILEGIFFKRGFRGDKVGTKGTVKMIMRAIKEVKKRNNFPEKSSIVIIGAEGFIGEDLANKLSHSNKSDDIVMIDVKSQDKFPVIARILEGTPTIIVDCSGPGVLQKHYLEHFKKDFIVLNEVYFDLDSEYVRRLVELGVKFEYIAGTDGETFPPNREPYGKAIPGCASWDDSYGAIVKRIA